MRTRKYKDGYAGYLAHQRRKTESVKAGTCKELGNMGDRIRMFVFLFSRDRRYIPESGKALCLGARRGEEVLALRHLGLEAIGVDLVAFPPIVVQADIHCLPYADGEFDFIFSNSIDHILAPQQVAKEIGRVLKPGGIAMFHLSLGIWSEEMSFGMDTSKDFIRWFRGFTILHNHKMQVYGGGMNALLVLEKEEASKCLTPTPS